MAAVVYPELLIEQTPDWPSPGDLPPEGEYAVRIGCTGCKGAVAQDLLITGDPYTCAEFGNELMTANRETGVPITLMGPMREQPFASAAAVKACQAGEAPCDDPQVVEVFTNIITKYGG